jgi:hypothetical protein
MLIGGVAVIARGVRRLTDDVDATVWAEGLETRSLLGALAAHRIVPRIDDALAFARRSQVILLQHEPSGVDIDLSLAWLLLRRHNDWSRRSSTSAVHRAQQLMRTYARSTRLRPFAFAR